jgi:hypothetical protein
VSRLWQVPSGADEIAAAVASPEAGSNVGGRLGLITPCWGHPGDGSSSGSTVAAAAPLHSLLRSASRLRQQVVSRPRACPRPGSASRIGLVESGVCNPPPGVAGAHFLKVCKAVKQRVTIANSSKLGNEQTGKAILQPRQ